MASSAAAAACRAHRVRREGISSRGSEPCGSIGVMDAVCRVRKNEADEPRTKWVVFMEGRGACRWAGRQSRQTYISGSMQPAWAYVQMRAQNHGQDQRWLSLGVGDKVWVYVCACTMYACVCVSVRERERVCVCVWCGWLDVNMFPRLGRPFNPTSPHGGHMFSPTSEGPSQPDAQAISLSLYLSIFLISDIRRGRSWPPRQARVARRDGWFFLRPWQLHVTQGHPLHPNLTHSPIRPCGCVVVLEVRRVIDSASACRRK